MRFLYSVGKLCNSSAEGLEGKLSELEALLTEGDTYKGNAECNTKYEVKDCEYDTAEDVPKYVEEGALSIENYALAEGEKHKLSHLEVLLTEGDTDEGNAECKTKYEVNSSKDEATEYAPKEITEFFHCDELLKIIF